MNSSSRIPLPLLALFVLIGASSCAGTAALAAASRSGSSTSSGDAGLEFDPYRRWEELSSSYRHYEWNDAKRGNGPELLAALRVVRDDPGWKAFVYALNTCDQSVNSLLEQNIVDWTNAGSKIALVNDARNAWRRACTFGIMPPDLPRGWASFTESGILFTFHIKSSSDGVLIARSPRGQVMGFFDLELHDDGDQHIMTHMLQGVIRYPDAFLSYPWDIVMAVDTIFIDDVWVHLDRVENKAHVRERHGMSSKPQEAK